VITILTTTGPRTAAAKTWRRGLGGAWQRVDFQAGGNFRHREAQVSDIYSLATVLERVTADRRSFVIRGEIKPELVKRETVRRRIHSDQAAFDPCPQQWIMLDFDKIEMPPGYDLADDPEAAIEWLIYEYLPEAFHDVTCYWQLSASAGVRDQTTISAHIWYWLDRAVGDDDLKAWAAVHAPAVDSRLFNPVQIHYTAAPIFENAVDPIPHRRQGLMDRELEEVAFPEIDRDLLKTEFVAVQKSAGIVATGETFADRLAQMGDGPGRLGFHVPIRDAIMVYVRENKVLLADMQGLKAQIRDAIMAAPKARGRDVRDYLADQYLDASIQGAIRRKSAAFIQGASHGHDNETTDLDAAETRLAAAVGDFLQAANGALTHDLEAPVHAIGAELGLGKTEVVLRRISETALQQISETVNLDHLRVHYYVRGHKLAAEVAERFNAMSGKHKARIWKGRARIEEDGRPATASDGVPMCFDDVREQADVYELAGLSVAEKFCKTCPHFGSCGWSRQVADKGPGLVVLPVEYAFEKSATRADVQVLDETFWSAAMREARVALGTLSIGESVPGRRGGLDFDASADLASARGKLRKAFEAAAGDIPTIDQLRAAGITLEIIRRAKAIEHQRADSIIHRFRPGLSAGALQRLWSGFGHRDARRWARAWQMIEDQLDLDRDRLHGFRRPPPKVDDDGDPKELLFLRWSRDLKAPDIPTLVLDATVDEQIIRRFLPGLDKIEQIRVAAKHATVVQIMDRVVSKSMIAPDPGDEKRPGDSPEELKRKRNRVRDLARIMEVVSAGRGKVGLFTYQATEMEIQDQLPENVTVAHFNNFRGLDRWRDADAIVVAGRPQPSEAEVEQIAEGLFYKSPEQIRAGAGRYGQTLRRYQLQGQTIEVETDAHPDPLVEAVRWQITEAEIIQAVGRARAIRRTEADPVLIVLLTSVPIPVPVDVVTTWADLVPDRHQVMAARGAVLDHPTDAVRAYSDLFETAQGFRDTKRRSRAFPYIDSPIGKCTTPRKATYQLRGRGQKPKTVTYDPDIIPDIRNWLSERLGVDILRLVEEMPTGQIIPPEDIGETPTETEYWAKVEQEVDVLGTQDEYISGIMSWEQSLELRDAYQAAGLTQQQAADILNISRPHLANAMACRYPLSEAKVVAIKDFVKKSPDNEPRLF